jgi:hypothetical protein
MKPPPRPRKAPGMSFTCMCATAIAMAKRSGLAKCWACHLKAERKEKRRKWF